MSALPLHFARALVTASLVLVACGDDKPSPSADTTGDSFAPETFTPNDTQGANRPPELERIGDRVAAIGRTLVITVNARDPDGDPLTWSLFGNVPEGARFDKAARRFEWAPTEAGRTVFLTFVVSDGQEFDRETIRIQTVAELTENPPVFTRIGDRAIPVDVLFELRLEATDPDGDPVTYGHDGTLPDGATLDSGTGIFSWTPTTAQAGITHELVFLANDSTSSTTLSLRLVVDDGRPGLQVPPAFTMSKAASATAGSRLELPLDATDPNGDALTFGVLGDSPTGSTLNGRTWSWTPSPDDAGRAVPIVFSASDGTFTAIHTVTVSVQRPTSGTCAADPNEPNDTFATATSISIGTLDAAICDAAERSDSDYLRITVPANQTLVVRLEFDANLGDLDLYLLDSNEDILAASEGVGSVEQVSFDTTTSATFTIGILGYSDVPLSVPYKLVTSFAPANACIDDTFAGNHTPATARPFNATVASARLQLCAGKPDYWSFQVSCGQRIEALLDIGNSNDLDMYIYDSVDFTGPAGREPIGAAITESSLEAITIPAAWRTGQHLLEVVSYPNNALSAPYELLIETTGGCTDDAVPNDTRARARALPGGMAGGSVTGIVCCTQDWFSVNLNVGDEFVVESTPTGGPMTMTAFAPNGTTQLDNDGPGTSPGLLLFEATTAGTHYIRVTGHIGVTYRLEYGAF